MERLNDWQSRLATYLEGISKTPFSYGFHDCALFCAGAVNAMTGTDLAKGWRGYRSRSEGIRKLRSKGMIDHVGLVDATFPECPPLMAMPGDIALVEDGGLGIIQGRGIYVLTAGGLGVISLLAARRAWHV